MVSFIDQSFRSFSTGRAGTEAEPFRPGACTATLANGGGNVTATLNFDGKVEGTTYPSLSPTGQEEFKVLFCRELDCLENWCVQNHWLPSAPPTHLNIFVSDEYKVSKALRPAAIGQRGRMEFPAWKVVAGEAAVMHELVHVYFPNGNRLLAEGLAIYLQATIGGNPAFPNFGRPLHDVARELLPKMVPEFASGDLTSLEKLRIGDLDKIATPSGLRLRVGPNLYQIDSVGQAHLYPIVGSFVQFIIEAEGLDKFRSLFMRTPLEPFERNAGSPARWAEVYEASLDELERKWKSKMAERSTIG
jgi:hypothetical protein